MHFGWNEGVCQRETTFIKGGIDPKLFNAASTLLYLTALKQCPKKPAFKN